MFIDVRHQRVDVKVCNLGAGPGIVHAGFERCAVLVNAVDGCDRLKHAVADLGNVTAGYGFFVGKKLRRIEAAGRRNTVLRAEVQRREVHEYEVAGAVAVKSVYGCVHTVYVVDERLIGDLFVGQKSIVSDVVGADPDGVDGAGGGPSEEGGAVLGDVFRVGDKSGEFVVCNVREWGVDGAEPARGDIVGTDSAANGVIIESGVTVDGGVARPDTAASRSFVGLH